MVPRGTPTCSPVLSDQSHSAFLQILKRGKHDHDGDDACKMMITMKMNMKKETFNNIGRKGGVFEMKSKQTSNINKAHKADFT